MCMYIQKHTHTHTHIYIYMHTCMYIYIYVRVCCTDIYIYIYIYIYKYTYMLGITPNCTHSCATGRAGSLSELTMIGSEAPSVAKKKLDTHDLYISRMHTTLQLERCICGPQFE